MLSSGFPQLHRHSAVGLVKQWGHTWAVPPMAGLVDAAGEGLLAEPLPDLPVKRSSGECGRPCEVAAGGALARTPLGGPVMRPSDRVREGWPAPSSQNPLRGSAAVVLSRRLISRSAFVSIHSINHLFTHTLAHSLSRLTHPLSPSVKCTMFVCMSVKNCCTGNDHECMWSEHT